MGEEAQALADLRDDILRDQLGARVELEVVEGCQQFLGRKTAERRQGKSVTALERQLHGAGDAIEALAMTSGAGFAVRRRIIRIEGAKGVGDFIGHFLIFVGLQHPIVDAAMTAAGWAPAAWGVEGKTRRWQRRCAWWRTRKESRRRASAGSRRPCRA